MAERPIGGPGTEVEEALPLGPNTPENVAKLLASGFAPDTLERLGYTVPTVALTTEQEWRDLIDDASRWSKLIGSGEFSEYELNRLLSAPLSELQQTGLYQRALVVMGIAADGAGGAGGAALLSQLDRFAAAGQLADAVLDLSKMLGISGREALEMIKANFPGLLEEMGVPESFLLSLLGLAAGETPAEQLAAEQQTRRNIGAFIETGGLHGQAGSGRGEPAISLVPAGEIRAEGLTPQQELQARAQLGGRRQEQQETADIARLEVLQRQRRVEFLQALPSRTPEQEEELQQLLGTTKTEGGQFQPLSLLPSASGVTTAPARTPGPPNRAPTGAPGLAPGGGPAGGPSDPVLTGLMDILSALITPGAAPSSIDIARFQGLLREYLTFKRAGVSPPFFAADPAVAAEEEARRRRLAELMAGFQAGTFDPFQGAVIPPPLRTGTAASPPLSLLPFKTEPGQFTTTGVTPPAPSTNPTAIGGIKNELITKLYIGDPAAVGLVDLARSLGFGANPDAVVTLLQNLNKLAGSVYSDIDPMVLAYAQSLARRLGITPESFTGRITRQLPGGEAITRTTSF